MKINIHLTWNHNSRKTFENKDRLELLLMSWPPGTVELLFLEGSMMNFKSLFLSLSLFLILNIQQLISEVFILTLTTETVFLQTEFHWDIKSRKKMCVQETVIQLNTHTHTRTHTHTHSQHASTCKQYTQNTAGLTTHTRSVQQHVSLPALSSDFTWRDRTFLHHQSPPPPERLNPAPDKPRLL